MAYWLACCLLSTFEVQPGVVIAHTDVNQTEERILGVGAI
jgi:hypothetical protein